MALDEEALNLPVKNSAVVEISLPKDIEIDDTLKQVKAADLQIANDMLRACYMVLGAKRISVSGMCKAIETTMKAVEHRRKVLCMQYGSPSNVSKSPDFDPLD